MSSVITVFTTVGSMLLGWYSMRIMRDGITFFLVSMLYPNSRASLRSSFPTATSDQHGIDAESIVVELCAALEKKVKSNAMLLGVLFSCLSVLLPCFIHLGRSILLAVGLYPACICLRHSIIVLLLLLLPVVLATVFYSSVVNKLVYTESIVIKGLRPLEKLLEPSVVMRSNVFPSSTLVLSLCLVYDTFFVVAIVRCYPFRKRRWCIINIHYAVTWCRILCLLLHWASSFNSKKEISYVANLPFYFVPLVRAITIEVATDGILVLI